MHGGKRILRNIMQKCCLMWFLYLQAKTSASKVMSYVRFQYVLLVKIEGP